MRTPTGTLLRAGLGVVLGLALVAGCSDEPKAGTIKPPRSTPTTSSASPTPATPEAQIEAAVRAYYAELTRAAQTNDTSRLRSMTTKGCPCYRSVGVIDSNRRHGETTPDAEFRLTFIRLHDVEEQLGAAEVKTRDAAYDVMRKGKVVDHIGEASTHLDLSLVLTPDNRWIIGNQFNLDES